MEAKHTPETYLAAAASPARRAAGFSGWTGTRAVARSCGLSISDAARELKALRRAGRVQHAKTGRLDAWAAVATAEVCS